MIAAWWATAFDYSMLAGAFGLALLMRFGKGLPSGPRQVLALLRLALLLVPLVSLYFSDNQSVTLVIQQETAAALLSILFGVALIVGSFRIRKKRDGTEIGTGRRIIWFLIGSAIAIYGLADGLAVIKDQSLPREHVLGVVAGVNRSHRSFRGHTQAAEINVGDRWYYATTDIEPQFHIGGRIDAEAGAGSHYILAVTTTPP